MGYKDKTYGFKFLVAHDSQIGLQLEKKKFPHFLCFFSF